VDDVCDVSEGVLARRTVNDVLVPVDTGVVVTDCDDDDDVEDEVLRTVFDGDA